MSLWGSFTSIFKGQPGAPRPKAYQPDPYARQFQGRGALADEATYRLLEQELARKPGFTPEEYRQISEVPVEYEKLGEQNALRELNQTAGATGRFGSGGRTRVEGGIRSEGLRTRAGILQEAAARAASFERADLERQLGLGGQYALSHQAIGQRETESANAYQQALNELAFRRWLAQLEQYNLNYERGSSLFGAGLSAASNFGAGAGAGAGGGGGGMGSPGS